MEDILIGPSRIKTKCLKPAQKPQLPVIFYPPQIKKIKAKTLFLTGENETMYDSNEAKEYFDKHFINGESEIFPNIGHDLFFLKSDLLTDRVISFIKKS